MQGMPSEKMGGVTWGTPLKAIRAVNSPHLSTTLETYMKTIHDEHYARLVSTLRSRRVAIGLDQTSLARSMGRSNSWVSKIEHREIRLDVMTFVRFCRALGIHASALIQTVEEELDDSDSSLYLLERIAGWPIWLA